MQKSNLRNVPPESREAITHIYNRLSEGKDIYKQDVGLCGVSFSCMREEHIAEIFHITKRQVSNWNIAGCPKGPKGYDLYHVILWYVKREAEKNAPKYDSEAQNVEGPVSLKDKKTLEEIAVLQRRQEKMDFEMQELKDTTIPKDVHKRSVSAVIEAFVSFLRNSLKRNVASFRAVPDVEANDMIDKFCIDLTQHMANSARQAERV